jgi:hypothetical protein
MKKIFILSVLILLIHSFSFSQGCVAIRGNGGVCTMQHMEDSSSHKKWQLITNYRYFKSFRHFVGKEEQLQRLAEHTEVINWQHTINYTLLKKINNRWSLGIDIPVLINTRSSKYEHYGNTSTSINARQQTHSFGMGDIRFSGYYWLIDSAHSKKGNVRVGMGIKLPTGDYRVQDLFRKNDTTYVLGPVDQSIQLGDGGLGFSLEANGFYNFNKHFSVFGNLYYLINPREHNGVSTARGGTVTTQSMLIGSNVMSVPDQYLLRGGFNYMYKHLTLSGSVRMECIPVHDLIGGSNGFRRPGYIISAEPGLNYEFKNCTVFASVPFAIERNRTQSVPDKKKTSITGVYSQGDAAFADYSINAGVVVPF